MMGQNFAQEMQKEFEISMLGELTFFLGLQVIQDEKAFLFFNQSILERN